MTYAVRMPEFDGNCFGSIDKWLLEEGEPIVPGLPIAEVYTHGSIQQVFADCYGTVSWKVEEGISVGAGKPIIHIEPHKDDGNKKSGLHPRRCPRLWRDMKGIAAPKQLIYS